MVFSPDFSEPSTLWQVHNLRFPAWNTPRTLKVPALAVPQKVGIGIDDVQCRCCLWQSSDFFNDGYTQLHVKGRTFLVCHKVVLSQNETLSEHIYNVYELSGWYASCFRSISCIQTYCQRMIGVSNHLLGTVFRAHYHSQKVIGPLGICLVASYPSIFGPISPIYSANSREHPRRERYEIQQSHFLNIRHLDVPGS